MILRSMTMTSGASDDNKSVSQPQTDFAELRDNSDKHEHIARLEAAKKTKVMRKAEREQKLQMKAIKSQNSQDTSSQSVLVHSSDVNNQYGHTRRRSKRLNPSLSQHQEDWNTVVTHHHTTRSDPKQDLLTEYISTDKHPSITARSFLSRRKEKFINNASAAAQRHSRESGEMILDVLRWLWNIILRLSIRSWLRSFPAKLMVRLSMIVIGLWVLYWFYAHLWIFNRSILDTLAIGICQPSYVRSLCAKACRPSSSHTFPTICTKEEETPSEAFTFQDTYGDFTKMLGLKTAISEIPSRLLDDRQNLGFHLTRFKSLNREEPGIWLEDQDSFIRRGDYVHRILEYLPDYLMIFFSHVDSMADMVLFQSNVTKEEIGRSIQNIRSDLDTTQSVHEVTHQSTRKVLRSRFFDHASVWKEKIRLLIEPGMELEHEILRLEPLLRDMRRNLVRMQQRIETETPVIVKAWRLILRTGQSWGFALDTEFENDVQPYRHALSLIHDLESNYAQLERHFPALWEMAWEIYLFLDELVFKARRKDFHLEPGARGVVQLQAMYEAIDSDAKGIEMAINDAHVVRPKQLPGPSGTKGG